MKDLHHPNPGYIYSLSSSISLIAINSPLTRNQDVVLQLYSTVTLRHGEKKHYNNKVDVYSFGIVLWELLTNRMPFEGMSNLQAAYAAAFKVRHSYLCHCIIIIVIPSHVVSASAASANCKSISCFSNSKITCIIIYFTRVVTVVGQTRVDPWQWKKNLLVWQVARQAGKKKRAMFVGPTWATSLSILPPTLTSPFTLSC